MYVCINRRNISPNNLVQISVIPNCSIQVEWISIAYRSDSIQCAVCPWIVAKHN